MLKMISAEVPLSIHGSAHVELQLEEKKFDVHCGSKPPNLGGHPWPGLPSGAARYHRFGSKEAVPERRREGYTTERTNTTAISE